MIKKIHTFGTSFTDGGGFEFNLRKNVKEYYKPFAENDGIPLEKFWFSWPGQLQKKIGSKIKVINHAKSGAGNDRMIRKVWKTVTNPLFSKESEVLIIEFAHAGRLEFYSNEIKDYLVINYHYRELKEWDENENFKTHFVPPNEEYKPKVHGMVYDYNATSEDSIMKNEKVSAHIPTLQKFLENHHSYDDWKEKTDREITTLLDFLDNRKIKYYISEPYIFSNYEVEQLNSDRQFSKLFDFNNHYGFVEFYNINKLSITNETGGECNDGHMGFEGAKRVSDIIYNKLKLDNLNY